MVADDIALSEDSVKPFPLENILTCTFSEWVSTQQTSEGYSLSGARASDYELKGVFAEVKNGSHSSLIESFASNIPSDAEVVVGYRLSNLSHDSNTGRLYGSAYGTAVIRKKK